MSTEHYKEAGVNLDAANELVSRISPLLRATFHASVITNIGQFGGLYSLGSMEYEQPVLVSSTDGVGTKLKIAFMANRHDTVGIDLVAMSVNDILVQGARPLFFLDYFAVGRLDLDLVSTVIAGIADGCRQAKCSLIGGETAEMPDFYRENEYDLAGFAVGIAEKEHIVDGSDIRVGNQIVGLASSGLHSNGYTLVRKIIFEELGLGVSDFLPECGCTVAEELLRPTRIYAEAVQVILRDYQISGMAHITGGGLLDNLERILPRACQARIREGSWPVPAIFSILKQHGRLSDSEMRRVFNNGIGYVLVVRTEELTDVLELLHGLGQPSYHIGEIQAREEGEPAVIIV
ncbi:MAG: phosphoribosylformylglycinamidine cyclo-ligase [Deltaproteobacteria bacterium]|nr:phosphoribosylformylglycinamidine cyclo-ligase [Deltaproteobacteria bacterium]MBW2071283.1 phosphoribosylformylglycinamidine cyclo-ligase [Deltaproteobacteria bacterium]